MAKNACLSARRVQTIFSFGSAHRLETAVVTRSSAIFGSSSLGISNCLAPAAGSAQREYSPGRSVGHLLCCDYGWPFCSSGDLRRGLLHRGLRHGGLLRRHLHWCLYRCFLYNGFLGNGFLRSTLLRHCWLLRGPRGMERRPALLCSFSNRSFACGTELPFAFRSFGCLGCVRRRLGRLLGFSPASPLCITDALPSSCT